MLLKMLYREQEIALLFKHTDPTHHRHSIVEFRLINCAATLNNFCVSSQLSLRQQGLQRRCVHQELKDLAYDVTKYHSIRVWHFAK